MYGITNIIFTLNFLFLLKDSVKGLITTEGNIFEKAMSLFPVIGQATTFAKGLPETYKELLDLDDEERQQVIAHFEKELELPKEDVENKIEATFEWALHTFDFLNDVNVVK